MPRCRNCGRKTEYGYFCEWCHYPLSRRGVPWQVRRAVPPKNPARAAGFKTEQIAQVRKEAGEANAAAKPMGQVFAQTIQPEMTSMRRESQRNDVGESQVRGKIKVFIVDDDRLFRRGLRLLLAQTDDIELIGESDFLEGTVMIIEALAPDVAIIDIKLPSMKGLDLAQCIRQRSPHVALIMLTPYEDDNQIFETLKMGAAGYLKKSTAPGELMSAIRRISRGEHIVDELLRKPTIARRVLIHLQHQQRQGLIKPLSSEEIETLVYFTGNRSPGRTADIESRSEQLITNQTAFILSKLAAKSTDQPDNSTA